MDKPSRRFGICPPFYRWCLCGRHSQTEQPCWISMPWRVNGILQYELLAHPQDKTSKKNLKWIPPKQLQVDALMYLCLIKRRIRKKMKLLKSPGFHLEISAMVKRRALMDSAKGFRWVCTKTRAMDRTVCNLFLFPKKPYCYCNIMKNINVVLWRLILHYIVDFLFSFWFSFLTEMLYHIF